MKYFNVNSVSLRMHYNWNMISQDFAIMHFVLEQQGSHSEWTVVNEASVAVNSNGNVDASPKRDNYNLVFKDRIAEEARTQFFKMINK